MSFFFFGLINKTTNMCKRNILVRLVIKTIVSLFVSSVRITYPGHF